MNNFVKIIIPLLFFVLSLGCKKEKPALIQPCELSKPVKADFWIGQSMKYYRCNSGGNDTIMLRDYETFNQGGFLYFTADVDCYDELEWIIGSDPNHQYGKQIYVQFFSQSVIGQTIPITLIAKKRPNTLCNPADDGVDTMVKNIYFDPAPGNIYGNFLGYNLDENPNDTFVVWIKDYTQTQLPRWPDIVGLPKGTNYQGVDYWLFDFNGAHRILSFCQETTVNGTLWDVPGFYCPHTKGIINYSANFDTITINYHYANDVTLPNEGNNRIFKTFKGVRI